MSAVLFLDIDGVLNCRRTFGAGLGRVDPAMVRVLDEVVAATGCRIVVSSTWREGPYRGPLGCRAILRAHGLRAPFHRDWRTKRLEGIRGHEIADWLIRNGSPPYAIVDDDSDMLPKQRPFLVQTDFEHGLTGEHAARLIAILKGRPGIARPSSPTTGGEA